MTTKPIIVWFRQDLRRSDNPALYAAYESGAPVLPVYILDDVNPPDHMKMGAASRVWLHHSLTSLNKSLGGHLYLAAGDAAHIIPALAQEVGAQAVHWNRCYEHWSIERDKHIKEQLKDNGIGAHSHNGSLLWEPWTTTKSDGTAYKVYSAFYKHGCLKADPPRRPLPAPERLTYADTPKGGLSVDDLNLLPQKPEPRWDIDVAAGWTISEDGAQAQLEWFHKNAADDYKAQRDFPAIEGVSRLSSYLHFGELSPHQAWHKIMDKVPTLDKKTGRETYLAELGWREFNHSLIYHFPKITWDNMNEKFNDFPWRTDESADFIAWRRGLTGYPIVDAAMRQLWQEGWMHNRCRMIVGSFLVKHLLIHWRKGEEWFWDCLFDADAPNNKMNWQWVAGCGADASPYFRIFNPILQSQKFDASGAYIKKYVPELKNLPADYIHAPWDAPSHILHKAGIELGKTYPEPIVDHGAARTRALDALKQTQ